MRTWVRRGMRTDGTGAPQKLSLRGGQTAQKPLACVTRSGAVLGPSHIVSHLILVVVPCRLNIIPSPSRDLMFTEVKLPTQAHAVSKQGDRITSRCV